MERAEKILTLNSEMEAQVLENILNEQDIPHIIKNHHDTVYNGIYQMSSGWGHLEALPEDTEKIKAIYNDMLENMKKR